MSKGSTRLGWTRRAERQPGIGRHFGLLHIAGVNDTSGRNVSVGRLAFDRGDLEPLRERGIRLNVTVIGVLHLARDVSPALAEAVLDARVIGFVIADARTKAALTR